MARLGRSRPANWLTRAHKPSLAIPATATLAPALSLTAVAPISGGASQGVVTNIGPAPIPPATGSMAAGVSLTAGGAIVQDAALPVAAQVTAVPSAWLYTGTVPVAYPQYLEAGGSLAVEPGEALVAMSAASGWFYDLPVPPPDGRWVTLGGGGELLAEAEQDAGPGDLSWDPPAAMAHMPVPFSVIAERITRRQQRDGVVVSRD